MLGIETFRQLSGIREEVLTIYRLVEYNRRVGQMNVVNFGLPPNTENVYYLMKLWIEKGERSKGYGGKTVDWLTSLILAEGAIGILLNRVETPGAEDLYVRRGWRQCLCGMDSWEYTSSDQVTEGRLKEIADMVTYRNHSWFMMACELLNY